MTVAPLESRVRGMMNALPEAAQRVGAKLETQRFIFAKQEGVSAETVFSDIWTDAAGKRFAIH